MRHWSHPCVLGLYDIVEPSLSTRFDDLYIVTPLLTTDLSRIVYSRTQLSDPQVLYLFYQTCCGVHYINSAGVLHRDLKPANLIVDVKSRARRGSLRDNVARSSGAARGDAAGRDVDNSERAAERARSGRRSTQFVARRRSCALKVCDFGLSRPDTTPSDAVRRNSSTESVTLDDDGDAYLEPVPASDTEQQAAFTEYVVTRWYRAPEVMLGFHRYGAAIDAWSVACIFCEVCLKEPLFPGNDYLHQLKIILQQIGKPGEADQWFVKNANAKAFLDRLPAYPRRPLSERLPRAPTGLVALSERMLAFDPKQRATMARSLADPCFDDYREDDLEARAGYRVEMDDVEAVAIDASAIRALLWKDIRSFHRDSDPLGDRGGSPDSSHDGATDDGAFDAETPNALGGFSAALTMITPPDTTHLKHRAGAPK